MDTHDSHVQTQSNDNNLSMRPEDLVMNEVKTTTKLHQCSNLMPIPPFYSLVLVQLVLLLLLLQDNIRFIFNRNKTKFLAKKTVLRTWARGKRVCAIFFPLHPEA